MNITQPYNVFYKILVNEIYNEYEKFNLERNRNF